MLGKRFTRALVVTTAARLGLIMAGGSGDFLDGRRHLRSEIGLASATDVAVDPAESSFSRSNISFSLTGADGTKSVWLQVFDAAGNSATTSDTIGLDTEDPTVTCTAASFLLNEANAEVSATVTDTLSGAAASPISAAADTSSVGSKSVSLTGYDNAGNSTTESCAYSVVYAWDRLLPSG
jgi:hypothetical protein